jgi:23S rRNA pseudouridine2605 synthase
VTHPRYEVEKEYHVKLSGALTQEDLKRAVKGLPLYKGQVYRFKTIASLKKAEKNTWYRVTVTEGKYHHIRKVAEALSHRVLKLRRVRVNGFTLGGLKPGEWTHIDPQEIKRFLRQQTPSGTGSSGRAAP